MVNYGYINKIRGVGCLSFNRYRESLAYIQKMAGNYTSLSRAGLAELNRLNTECVSLNEEIVKSFSSMVDEIEEGLTHLLDRLDLIKKDLNRISGPEGTLGDILKLEPIWSRTEALRGSIRSLLESEQKPGCRDEPGKAVQAASGEVGGSPAVPGYAQDAKESREIQDLIGLARKEAAAAAEKSPAAKVAPAAKAVPAAKMPKKAPPPGQSPKPAVLQLKKECGENEKKIMEEISKNIEAIKNSKKKI